MDLTRRTLLALGAGAALAPAYGPDRRLIVVFVQGGWDTTYCIDPKLGLPTVQGPEFDHQDPSVADDREAIRTWGGIPVVVNPVKRPSVGRFFDRWSDRCAVVNGIATGSISHGAARARVLSGSHLPEQPDLCAAVGFGSTRFPVGSVDFSGDGVSGVAAPSTTRIGRSSQIGLLTGDVPHGDLLDDWFRTRLDQVDPGAHREGALEAIDRARRLRDEAGRVLGALPLDTHDLDDDVATAVALLAAGVTRAALLKSAAAWDTHTTNATQHALLDDLFFSLGLLTERLDGAGILDDTLVVVVSEMTRAPLRNATDGKGHWPGTSALLIGSGVAGGRVVGATDRDLLPLPVDGVGLTHATFAAGILAHLDVDPERWLPGVVPFSHWAG